MTFDLSALIWSAFFLTLWGYAYCLLPRSAARRVLVTVWLVLALVALSPILSAHDTIIYFPPPCEDLPWWLVIVEPRCW